MSGVDLQAIWPAVAGGSGREAPIYVSSVRLPEIPLIVRRGGVDIMVPLTAAEARLLGENLIYAANGGR